MRLLPLAETAYLASIVIDLHTTLCRQHHPASEVWIALILDTLICHAKSVVWRSDAIPQVGLDVLPMPMRHNYYKIILWGIKVENITNEWSSNSVLIFRFLSNILCSLAKSLTAWP
jgi:hypothetical protein